MSHSSRKHQTNHNTRSSAQARSNTKQAKQTPPDPWALAIGRAIGEMCVEVGWTPADLATKAGVSLDTIQRLLGGQEMPYTTTYGLIRDAFLEELGERGPERVLQVLGSVWAAAHVWPRIPGEPPSAAPSGSGHTAEAGAEPGASSFSYQTIDEHTEQHTHVYHSDPLPRTTPSRRDVLMWGGLVFAGLAALSSLGVAADKVFFSGSADATPPWIDGWKPLIVPYGSPSDHYGAIALRNVQTGEQDTPLKPDASRHYVSYPSCVWSASRKQLYYIATNDHGVHDLWYTRFGPGNQKTIPQPPDGWPREFLPDRGPNCTSLGWTQDGQYLTYVGPDGKTMALNLDTSQEGTVQPNGSVQWNG